MVVIRLSRTGAKKSPFYHVVVTDSRNSRDSGRYIERLGYYNPNARGQEVNLHIMQERIEHWVKLGAQPSARVNTLIKKFVKGPAAPVSPKKSKTAKSAA